MKIWIKLAAVVVVAVLAASVFIAWRDARKEQAALQAELKTTQQALAEATARQASRDAAVNDLVAGLKKKEATVQKPAQVVAALPDVISLPTPITIDQGSTGAKNQVSGGERPASPPSSGQASAPPAGIQPKVNFPALGAAQADLADEKVKSQALGRERDDALRIARGGGTWRRIGRAAKWFLIGAATGAIAAKVAR